MYIDSCIFWNNEYLEGGTTMLVSMYIFSPHHYRVCNLFLFSLCLFITLLYIHMCIYIYIDGVALAKLVVSSL